MRTRIVTATMADDGGGVSNSATFPSPFGRLPTHIWEKIFSFLPISTLIISTSVCRSWKSVIRSQPFISFYSRLSLPDQDLYFLLFSRVASPGETTAVAYRPIDDRWITFSLPAFSCRSSCCNLRRIHASGGSHILAEKNNGSTIVYNLFTGESRSIAMMISVYFTAYAIALIEESSSEYKIVSVSTMESVRSQIYDSRTGSWVMRGQLPGQFAVLGNSACLDGILYCLGHVPDRLLAFDLNRGVWSVVDVAVLPLICSHIMVHRGVLYLVGGVDDLGDICGIGIWWLNWKEMRWEDVSFMPNGLLRRFCGNHLNRFEVVDQRGIICFCNTASFSVVLCDLSGMRWWRPVSCPLPKPKDKNSWLGHALEPCAGAIRPSD